MIKSTLTLLAFTINLFPLFGFTTFVLKNDKELAFGRNLDWVSDDGVIVVNQRNVLKTSLVFPPDKPTEWRSKYGSVTFNQFGKEFPFGGINEKGLVVEIMRVSGNYPEMDERTAVNELQWIQYQLDNSSSVEDVITSDKEVRISKIDQNLHFLICDGSGNVAVIEFDEKGMNVYKDSELPILVLENDPYPISLEKNETGKKCRFRTAADMLKRYKRNPFTSAVDYSFSILDEVALDGSWSIVYDIRKMEIQFKTSSFGTIRKIRIKDINFDCTSEGKLYDLTRKDIGYVNTYFVDYSSELNNKKFAAAINSNQIQLPRDILNRFYAYNETCSCVVKP